MKVNDIIKTANGIEYKVITKLGEGGQGAVWKVENQTDHREYALKFINEKDLNKRAEKIKNIEKLIKEKLDSKMSFASSKDGVSYAFPITKVCIQIDNETKVGYVMNLAKGKTINKMLIDDEVSKMTIKQKLELAKKVARAIAILHDFGYGYTDINWGNFNWNPQSDILYVIDCENVASFTSINDGSCAFLKGTGFFMAPEVAFDNIKAADNSDRYALAQMIFRLLTNNYIASAYHGIAMYSAVPACQNMLEVAEYEAEGDIDKNWRVFIFDRKNRANNIDDLCKNSTNPENKQFRAKLNVVTKIWNSLDERLKKQFYLAFSDPFNIDKRPSASMWVKVISEVLSDNKESKQIDANDLHEVSKIQNNKEQRKENNIPNYKKFVPSNSDYEKNTQQIYKAYQNKEDNNVSSNIYKPFVPQKGLKQKK